VGTWFATVAVGGLDLVGCFGIVTERMGLRVLHRGSRMEEVESKALSIPPMFQWINIVFTIFELKNCIS